MIKSFCAGFCLGVFGMDFFSALSEEESFLVVVVGVVPSSSLCLFRESPEFHDLLLRDKSSWRRCLLWHGCYLHLLALVGLLLGLVRLMMLLVLGWRDCWVLVLSVFL